VEYVKGKGEKTRDKWELKIKRYKLLQKGPNKAKKGA
jgi:hypothetical protein